MTNSKSHTRHQLGENMFYYVALNHQNIVPAFLDNQLHLALEHLQLLNSLPAICNFNNEWSKAASSKSFSFCLAIYKYLLCSRLTFVMSHTLSINHNWINCFVRTLPLLISPVDCQCSILSLLRRLVKTFWSHGLCQTVMCIHPSLDLPCA